MFQRGGDLEVGGQGLCGLGAKHVAIIERRAVLREKDPENCVAGYTAMLRWAK